MTIRLTAYETTACDGFQTQIQKTKHAIEDAFVNGWIHSLADVSAPSNLELNNSSLVRLVDGQGSIPSTFPAFGHPIIHDLKKTDQIASNNSDMDPNTNVAVIDVRAFGRTDTTGGFVIKNSIEFNLLVLRGQLNAIWANQNPNILRDISTLPLAVFASWLSENIARRFALDPREQMNLAIVSSVFYLSSFYQDHSEVTEREQQRMVVAIAKAVRVKAEDVFEVLDKVTYVSDISDFCKQAVVATDSVRLKELNAGVLISILGGTWFGTNYKETVAVAIEHPPTWIAIVFAAFSERTFKNSGIAKITERSSFRETGKDFTRAIAKLVESI